MSLDARALSGQFGAITPHWFRLYVQRIDATGNMARVYEISIEPDLFGGSALVRRWGRIRTRGQERVHLFEDDHQAISRFLFLVRQTRARGLDELFHMEAWPSSRSVTYLDIDQIAIEVGRLIGAVETDIDLEIDIEEAWQAWQNPLGGNRGRRPDRQKGGGLIATHHLGRPNDVFDRLGYQLVKALARLRQLDLSAHFSDERASQLLLENADLLADRRGRYVQLLGGCGHRIERGHVIEDCDGSEWSHERIMLQFCSTIRRSLPHLLKSQLVDR